MKISGKQTPHPLSKKSAAIRALEYARKEAGRVPSSTDIAKILSANAFHKINKYHGVDNLYRELGWVKSGLKTYPSPLRDKKRLAEELKKVIERIGRFPTEHVLKAIRRHDLRRPIAQYGGYKEVQKWFPEYVNLYPTPWKNIDYAAVRLLELKKRLSRWPMYSELVKSGNAAMIESIRNYHGKLENLKERAATLEPLLAKKSKNDLLAFKAKAGDQKALDALVKQNFASIEEAAKKHAGKGIELEVLRQEAAIIYIKSLRSWGLSTKYSFKTHAKRRMNWDLRDVFSKEWGREGKKKEALFSSEPAGARDLIPDSRPSPLESIISKSQGEKLRIAIRSLPQQERQVLRLRYGLSSKSGAGLKSEVVGILMDLSESRISQIETSAIEHLKEKLAK